MDLTDQELAKLMTDAHVIASVGLTTNPSTTGFHGAAYQQSQGYEVIPVNDVGLGDMILGHQTVNSVEDANDQNGQVDIVDVYGHELDVPNVIESAIRSGAKVLWLEPGASNAQAEQRARLAGMFVVSGKSFEREHRRLLSDRPQ